MLLNGNVKDNEIRNLYTKYQHNLYVRFFLLNRLVIHLNLFAVYEVHYMIITLQRIQYNPY